MSDFEDLIYALAAYAIFAALGGIAYVIIRKCVPGGQSRLLPLPRRPRGDWTGGDVILIFLMAEMISAFSLFFLQQLEFFEAIYEQSPTRQQQWLWAMLLAMPTIVAFVLTALFMLRGTRPADVGLGPVRIVPNILLGYRTFLLLSPPVWAINFLVLPFTTRQSHELEEILRNPLTIEWIVVILITVIGAPVYEELLFRGVVQGWLSRASQRGHIVVAIICILVASKDLIAYWEDQEGKVSAPSWQPLAFGGLLVLAYLASIGRSFSSSPVQAGDNSGAGASPVFRPYLAIFGSSILFASFHGAWPSPIPLFFLSLGLGWLAYRSQSLIGPMIAHGLFNGISCLALLLKAIG